MRSDESRQKETEAAVLLDRAFLHLPDGIGSQASRDFVRLIVEAAVLRMRAAEPHGGCAMTAWNGWAVVDDAGNLMGNLLSDGPLLFYTRRAAESWARGMDKESLSSDGHRAVSVRVTAEPQDPTTEGREP